MYLLAPVNNEPCFSQSSLMVDAEVHLTIIIRSTRADATTTLALVSEMSVGAATLVWAWVSASGIPSR